MEISVKVDFHHAHPQFNAMKALVEWADETGPVFRTQLKWAAPVGRSPNDPHPGRLRESIRYERHTTGNSIRLDFNAHVPYAKYVIHSTRPHVITPQAARALHWLGLDGGSVFAMLVHHPGTRANDFPTRVLRASQRAILENLRSHMTGGL